MKVHKLYTAIFLLGFFAVSCGKDPTFFIISTETVPKPPLIPGAPTNMVIFERNETPVLYVASGRLHSYARPPENPESPPQWNLEAYQIESPGGKIISLAVTKDRLYALCLNGESLIATLHYIGHSGDVWNPVELKVNDYPLIQSIHADPQTDRLFACARKRDSTTYALLYLDDADTPNTLKVLKADTKMLIGAVCRKEKKEKEIQEDIEGEIEEEEEVADIFYLCTRGDGMFRVSEADLAKNTDVIPILQLVNTSNENNSITFMGMIKLEDDAIIAVERKGGALYEVLEDGVSFAQMRNSSDEIIVTGRYSTGALALWKDYLNPVKKLLVVGIQGGLYSTSTSSYTNGYVEFELTPGGTFEKDSPRHDSNGLQTVSDTDRYTTSLGKHPINHLFQAPADIDDNMTFFASTQAAGLWSYRDRVDNGGWQWNAEEK